MTERKIWLKEEDQILKFLREQAGQKKWSKIAKKLQDDYSIAGRTGKQCRQRYHNHLDSRISFSQWTREEQKILFQMHDEVGNRWSIIAHKLPGRTDNCIKNHFYSKLRKAVRKLNRIIVESFKKQFKDIRTALLYKIIETSESKFRVSSMIDQEVADFCTDLKNRLFNFQEEFTQILENKQKDLKLSKKLILDIIEFQSTCKKTSSKKRKNSSTGNDLLHPNMYLKRTKSNSQCSLSDQSSFMSSSSFADQSKEEEEEEEEEDGLRATAKSLKEKVNSYCTTRSAKTSGDNLRLTRSRSRQQTFSGNFSKVQCLSQDAQKIKKYDFGSYSGENFLSLGTTQGRKQQPLQCFQGFLSNSRTSNQANFLDSIMIEQKIIQQKSSGSNKNENSQSNHSQINMFFQDSHFEMRILSPKNLHTVKNQSEEQNNFDLIYRNNERLMELQIDGMGLQGDDQIISESNQSLKTISLKDKMVIHYQNEQIVKKQTFQDQKQLLNDKSNKEQQYKSAFNFCNKKQQYN